MMGLINPDEMMAAEKQEMMMQKSAKPALDDGEDNHCFPYYDFTRSLIKRFDGSFLFILVLVNFNQGLGILISLSQQDLFKAYMD